MMSELKSLAGKRVTGLSMNPSRDVIAFHFPDSAALAFYTDGDCCSTSWIEHMEGVDALLGAEVLSADEVSLGEVSDKKPDQDYVQAYCVTLKLKGRPDFKIEFRNDSNGYYGGSLVPYYGDPLNEHLRPVTVDF